MVSHVYIVVLRNRHSGQFALRTCATRAMADAIKADVARVLPNLEHYEIEIHKSKLERMK